MKRFAAQRPDYAREHIANQFGLPGTAQVTIEVEGQGTVTLNSLKLAPATSWQGIYFQGIPLTLTATPAAGYTFVGWRISTGEEHPETSISLTPGANIAVTAAFAAK